MNNKKYEWVRKEFVKSVSGKNNCLYGVGLRGEKNGMYGKNHKEKSKQLMSEVKKEKGSNKGEKNGMYGKKGKDNPNYGRHNKIESNIKISKSQIGEKNHMSKFTWKIINKLRKLYKTGKYTQRELAKMFGMTYSNICLIINYKSWNNKKGIING